jgi:hypothetical protein
MSAPLRLLLLAALIAGCPTAQVNADDDDVVQDWDASGLQDWDASGLPEAPEPATRSTSSSRTGAARGACGCWRSTAPS